MDIEPQIISKADAKAAGLKRYFTGAPCSRGHVAERYIHGRCVPCAIAKSAEWRVKNPDRYRRQAAAHYAKNADATKERARIWHAANRVRAQEISREWARRHVDEMRFYRMASRARKFNCVSDLTIGEMRDVLSEQPSCRYCASEDALTIDHIVPLAKRGPNTKTNIQVLCNSCNSSKQDKDEAEFLSGRAAA